MSEFRFSVGPWNVHSGADSYGPATRKEIDFEEKVRRFSEMGFSALQMHDDDAIPKNFAEASGRLGDGLYCAWWRFL